MKIFRFVKRSIVLLVTAWLLWTFVSACAIARFATVSEEQPAEGIIVLGAAAWGQRPSPVFRERINHAINLYHGGYAPLIIFTGGRVIPEDLAESEVARRYAIAQGVPVDRILIETASRSTEQNLDYARQLAEARQLSRFILVSDPLHMKRVMAIAADQGLHAYSSPTATSRYRSLPARLEFLLRETFYYQQYLLRRTVERWAGGE